MKYWQMSLCTIVLMLLAGSLRVNAQTITLSASKMPLQGIITAIERQTGYSVLINVKDMEQFEPASFSVRDMPLTAFLDFLLKDQPLRYEITKKTITVYKTPQPEGHVIRIAGQITDSAGHPLDGATIEQKGKLVSAISDAQGLFLIDVENGALMTVSYVGFESMSFKARPGMTSMRVILHPLRRAIEEITVSTGYQRIPLDRAAGSFGVISQSTFEKRTDFNITDYIEGQVPGLLVSPTGQITIRGQSTIAADMNPLIVIDGFAVERPLSTINPDDIENITVLKDASAASIWGVRAANGVIVIQTKRGLAGRKDLDVSYSSTVSVTPQTKLSTLPFASTASFMDFEQYRVNNGMVFAATRPRPVLSPVVAAYLYDPASAPALVDSLKNIHSFNEFSSLFMTPATRQHYDVAVMARGSRSTQRASFSYDKIGQQFKGNTTERFVADLFQTTKITPRINLEMGLNYVLNNVTSDGMGFSDLTTLLPYQRILDKNGNYIPQPMTFYQPDKDSMVALGYPYNWDYNLEQEYLHKNNKDNSDYVNAIARLTYNVFKGLSAEVSYQYEGGTEKIAHLYDEQTYYVRNMVDFSTTMTGGTLTSGIPKGDIYNEANNRFSSQTLRNLVKYDGFLDRKRKHYLSGIGGMEIRQVASDGSAQTLYGYNPQSLQYTNVSYVDLYNNVLGAPTLIPNGSNIVDTLNRFVSGFSNIGYTYNERYTLNASARIDETNLFGTTSHYRNVWLWSSGFSWKVYKERFINTSIINSLILRATYGINGNVDRQTSPFLIADVATDQQTNQPYAYVANPANPLLRWERTAVTNFGMDVSVFKQRLKATLDWYNRNSSDLLGNATVNGTYGFTSAFINYASLRNRGIDLKLTGLIVDARLRWVAILNYGYNNNKVTKVDLPSSTVGYYLASVPQVGKPLNYLYSFRWAGLSSTGAPQIYDQSKHIVDYKTEVTDPTALVYNGSSVPTHYGALINEFSYKRWSLTTNMTFKMGYKFRVPAIQYQTISEQSYEVSADWDRRWKQPGDETRTSIPAAPTTIAGLNIYDEYSADANIRVQTASIVRLRECILSYTLPASVHKLTVGNINLGLQIRNLATHTFNKAGLDPEYLTTVVNSISINAAPRPEYSFFIKANF